MTFEIGEWCVSRQGSLSVADLTVLNFAIGASRLKDIKARFHTDDPKTLTGGESSDTGVCIKNADGMAAVFATGVLGPSDLLTSIYIAKAANIERGRLKCVLVDIPTSAFTSNSGIRPGMPFRELFQKLHPSLDAQTKVFCASYEINSEMGPLRSSKKPNFKGVDLTTIVGEVDDDRVSCIGLFGVASD